MNARVGLVMAAGLYLLAFGWALASGDEIRATPAPNRTHLGIYGESYQGDNGYRCVRVTGVMGRSPAMKLRLVNGGNSTFHLVGGRDYITAVNGNRVRNMAELRHELGASGEYCELQIYDRLTKRSDLYYTYLR